MRRALQHTSLDKDKHLAIPDVKDAEKSIKILDSAIELSKGAAFASSNAEISFLLAACRLMLNFHRCLLATRSCTLGETTDKRDDEPLSVESGLKDTFRDYARLLIESLSNYVGRKRTTRH